MANVLFAFAVLLGAYNLMIIIVVMLGPDKPENPNPLLLPPWLAALGFLFGGLAFRSLAKNAGGQ